MGALVAHDGAAGEGAASASCWSMSSPGATGGGRRGGVGFAAQFADAGRRQLAFVLGALAFLLLSPRPAGTRASATGVGAGDAAGDLEQFRRTLVVDVHQQAAVGEHVGEERQCGALPADVRAAASTGPSAGGGGRTRGRQDTASRRAFQPQLASTAPGGGWHGRRRAAQSATVFGSSCGSRRSGCCGGRPTAGRRSAPNRPTVHRPDLVLVGHPGSRWRTGVILAGSCRARNFCSTLRRSQHRHLVAAGPGLERDRGGSRAVWRNPQRPGANRRAAAPSLLLAERGGSTRIEVVTHVLRRSRQPLLHRRLLLRRRHAGVGLHRNAGLPSRTSARSGSGPSGLPSRCTTKMQQSSGSRRLAVEASSRRPSVVHPQHLAVGVDEHGLHAIDTGLRAAADVDEQRDRWRLLLLHERDERNRAPPARSWAGSGDEARLADLHVGHAAALSNKAAPDGRRLRVGRCRRRRGTP